MIFYHLITYVYPLLLVPDWAFKMRAWVGLRLNTAGSDFLRAWVLI
jgi:hypothetical protein